MKIHLRIAVIGLSFEIVLSDTSIAWQSVGFVAVGISRELKRTLLPVSEVSPL